MITWGMQSKERTGRVLTQGPDQIIPYCTRKSFLMMHETLVKLENVLNELGASDLPSWIASFLCGYFPDPTRFEPFHNFVIVNGYNKIPRLESQFSGATNLS